MPEKRARPSFRLGSVTDRRTRLKRFKSRFASDVPPPAATDVADAIVVPALPAVRLPQAVRTGTLPAIGFIIASTAVFCLGDVAAKALTHRYHGLEITWFRFVVFAAIMVPLVLLTKGPSGLVSRRPRIQFARGLSLALASACFILGLGAMPVSENTAIAFLSPLFVTALSIPLLKEVVGARRWAAAIVGFLGVMLIVRPGSDAFQIAALLPISAALIGAFGTLATRMLNTDAPETTLAWTAVVGFLTLSVAVPFVWTAPRLEDLPYAFATGLFSAIGHVFVVLAYRRAPASLLAPFTYTQLPFAAAASYLAFGDMPGVWTMAGMAVIAASGLYTRTASAFVLQRRHTPRI